MTPRARVIEINSFNHFMSPQLYGKDVDFTWETLGRSEKKKKKKKRERKDKEKEKTKKRRKEEKKEEN